ncbi:unnamed protein product, partial [Rotaria socialis]
MSDEEWITVGRKEKRKSSKSSSKKAESSSTPPPPPPSSLSVTLVTSTPKTITTETTQCEFTNNPQQFDSLQLIFKKIDDMEQHLRKLRISKMKELHIWPGNRTQIEQAEFKNQLI